MMKTLSSRLPACKSLAATNIIAYHLPVVKCVRTILTVQPDNPLECLEDRA